MLRIAVTGTGRIGKVHAAIVVAHPQARLVLVCDSFIEAAEVLAKPLGARTSADVAEAFSADDVDAVIIGFPTPLYAEYVPAAVRAGKAALREKPVASSVEAVRALADELTTFKHPSVMVDFQRRYDPFIAKAQRPAAKGRIGRIERLTIIPRGPVPPSAKYLAQSGGVFKNMAIHDFDEARFFPGEIVSVSAIGQKFDLALADVDDFDDAVMTLRAASGVVAIIKNIRHCISGYDQKVEVSRSEGEVVAENLRATSVQVNDATESVQQKVYLGFFLERYADAYRDELTALVDAVNNGPPMTPAVEDDVVALILVEAAERSARSGQTVGVTK